MQNLSVLLTENYVVLFMKGDSSYPICGLSSTVYELLKKCKLKFITVNLLANPHIHIYMKEKHPTASVPYLYVGGRFVGGYDKVLQLFRTGKLKALCHST